MLSILIPTYNYNISNLLKEIHSQVVNTSIEFEIICFNDNSKKFNIENQLTIEKLSNTKIINSKKNIGRTQARQELSNNSSYNWLLFLDADVIPKSKEFIKNYISVTTSGYEAIYGGFAYVKDRPDKNSVLRWKYGKTFEQISAKKRNLRPYQVIISANFLIEKPIFNNINTNINTNGYGLDNYFAAILKQKNIRVLHIDNEVYHLGIEKSTVYLDKVEEAIRKLLELFNEKKIPEHSNKLLTTFTTIKRLKLNYLLVLIYKVFGLIIKKNLLGKNPNMILLQLYKILYICLKDIGKK